jgi:hypothetical protein
VIALPVEANDKHWTPVTVTIRLIWSDDRRIPSFRCGVAHTLPKTTMAKFIGAAKKFDEIVRAIGSEGRFHGAEMLIAKGEKVRPHAKRV